MNLPNNDLCCGCSACASICPMGIIEMRADGEGFLQPLVDSKRCISCGQCEKVCPILNPSEERLPKECHAAKSKDFNERIVSSSGGIFSLLARNVIEKGGVVFGASWSNGCNKVIHIGIDNIADLSRLRESKYVQSEIGDSYKKCKKILEEGRIVLFSGCPCQISGLLSFLNRDYNNLLTQEVICNSVPSPKALKYWTESEKHKIPDEALLAIHFRDKSEGWHKTTLKYQFTTTTTTNLLLSVYYRLWQRGYTVRRSCIECRFRDFKSGSDLTLGDCWGIEKYLPEMDDNNGVSVVIVNTEKGRKFWSCVSQETENINVDYSTILTSNPCLHKSFDLLKTAGSKREKFFRLCRNFHD